jgi:TMEM175 potassium channel family protein
MDTSRLEAFSDGVVAILITIMVLELKVPHDASWGALVELKPVLLAYVLSFVYLGIYWNNHHHLIYITERVSGPVLWANLHLLFWLSLVPFATAWMGENSFATLPTAIYGSVLLAAGLAYTILVRAIIKQNGPNSKVAAAIGPDFKGYLSLALYVAAIPLAFVRNYIAGAIYVFVALMWLVPDRRIERGVER